MLDRRDYDLRQWTTADGLPNGVVTGLVLDRRGFLYVATLGGVARLDGQSVTTLSVADLPLLRSNQVTSIALGRRDDLWVGTPEGYLLRLQRGRMADSLAPLAGEPETVQRIVASAGGDIWVASSRSVRRFRDGAWQAVPHAPRAGVVHALLEDAGGTVWLADDGGLQRLSGEAFQSVTLPRGVGRAVLALASDARGQLWLGTTSGLALRGSDGVVLRVHLPQHADAAITALAVAPDGTLWLGGPWGVSAVRVTQGPAGVQARSVFSHPAGLDGTWVTAIAVDQQGTVAVGTANSGLRVLSPRLVTRVTRADGLPNAPVHHLVGDGDSAVLVGVGCAGVNRLAGSGIVRVPDRDLGVMDPCLRSLYRDPDGTLWLGQYRRVSARRPDGRIKIVPLDGIAVPLAAGPMLGDGAQGVFVGTVRGGLVHIDSAGRTVRVREVPRESVHALARDSSGALWVGLSGSLVRLQSGAAQLLTGEDGVPPGPVRVLRAEPDGTLWIGSYGGGLARLRDGHVERITTEGGLFDDAISALLADAQGRFWLMGNLGLLGVRRGRLDSVLSGYAGTLDGIRLGPLEGVPEGNGGYPAAWRTAEGHLLFASVDGITVVAEATLERVRAPPAPLLLSSGADSLRMAITDSAEVPAPGESVTLHVSAPSLGYGDRLQYRFRVRGRGEAWIDAGSRHSFALPPLPAGRHEVEVAVRSAGGAWSEEPAIFRLVVRQVWWKSWWLRALIAAAMTAGILQLTRMRLQAVERRNRELRHEIAQRERAELRAQQHLHELAHVSRVATVGELATSLAHELNQPLAAIVGNADAGRRILQRDGMSPLQVDELLDEIAREGRRASDIIRSLRQFLRRDAGERQPIHLRQAIEEVLPILRNQLQEAGTAIRLDLPADLPAVRGDRTALQQVVVNLLVNASDAMRDQPPGRRLAVVDGDSDDDVVRLVVRDSGRGVPPALQAEIFEPFTTSKPGGMGMGLAICRSIVEAHDGRIEVGTGEGGGATFVVTLPIGRADSGEQ